MKWIKKILDQLNEEVLLDEYDTDQKLKRLADLHRKNERIVDQPKNVKFK